jgi:uncharacterized protein (TIGR03118 family)
MHMKLQNSLTTLAAAASTGLALAVAAAGAPPSANSYTVHNLVSDQVGVADHVDSNLVNAWGLAASPTSPWWVADNETNVATVYTADGAGFPAASPLVVGVHNAPTGEVANSGPSFLLAGHPARFIFATEEGTILAWNSSLSPPTDAVVVADRSDVGAIYKGLAIAGDRLYATDFHNARVDVFNDSFGLANTEGAFVDPGLPAGFAPFGIQEIGGNIFVSYAKQDADAEDEVAGQGLGFVDAFDTSGAFLARIVTRGQLNAPWGMALAPGDFGRFSGDLLVGNFGDGEINAYAPQLDGSYERVGALRGSDHKSILIDGLWALQFGRGDVKNGSQNTLFFTAGPEDETHGLFGKITNP